VIKHILGGFAEVYDPIAKHWGGHSASHIAGINGTGGVIVAADSADTRGDERRVSRIFPLHENAVPAEDRRSAVTFGDFFVIKVDLREDPKTPHDSSDGIPVHLDQVPALPLLRDGWFGYGCHGLILP
jgi:hypothetical protein